MRLLLWQFPDMLSSTWIHDIVCYFQCKSLSNCKLVYLKCAGLWQDWAVFVWSPFLIQDTLVLLCPVTCFVRTCPVGGSQTSQKTVPSTTVCTVWIQTMAWWVSLWFTQSDGPPAGLTQGHTQHCSNRCQVSTLQVWSLRVFSLLSLSFWWLFWSFYTSKNRKVKCNKYDFLIKIFCRINWKCGHTEKIIKFQF